jgi:hypothetical protein
LQRALHNTAVSTSALELESTAGTLGFFGSLEMVYAVEVERWMHSKPGLEFLQRKTSLVLRNAYKKFASIKKQRSISS